MNVKLLGLVPGAVLVLLLLFGGLLYYTLRTKVQNVSKMEPIHPLIQHPMATKRRAWLVRQAEGTFYAEQYALLEDTSNLQPTTQTIEVATGSVLNIREAKIFTNGTSGIKHLRVVGEVFVPALNRSIPFEYAWGNYHFALFSNFKDYWTFPLALWQEEDPFTDKYRFEK